MMQDSKSYRIFILDVNQSCVDDITGALNREGYENIEAFTNSEDFNASLGMMPEICVLGYNIQENIALELLLKVKSTKPDIQVIFLSEEGDTNTALMLLAHGAAQYMVKNDTTVERLLVVVANIVASKLLEERKRESRQVFNTGITLAISILLVLIVAVFFSKG